MPEFLLDILKKQVVPALGCTEPTAVALAVSKVRELLGEEVKKIEIQVDKNIFKNGKEVSIPGTDKKGIKLAAILGFLVGKSSYNLQVLKDVNEKDVEKGLKLISQGFVKLKIVNNVKGLYINVVAKGEINTSQVVIKDNHTNIVLLKKNNLCLFRAKETSKNKKDDYYNIRNYSIKELVDFASNIDIDKIKFINDGIVMNKKIAEYGIRKNKSIGLGNLFFKEGNLAKAYTVAAAEARMSGCSLPVMSSAGSGNHGLITIIPVAVMGKKLKLPEEKIIRAVTLSHLITILIKSYTGFLTPVCGCAVAAGVGASAGLTYLKGGNLEQIGESINIMVSGVAGMLCDGAKLGCAYKVAISVTAALDASNMALNNVFIPVGNGIIAKTPEETIVNLGAISTKGMAEADDVILEIMMN